MGRLEDQFAEGEIDSEDFLAWHLAPSSVIGHGRGAAYLGLEAFATHETTGSSEVGALLVLGLPLDRFIQRRALALPTPPSPAMLGAPTSAQENAAAWFGARAAEPMIAQATLDGLRAHDAGPALFRFDEPARAARAASAELDGRRDAIAQTAAQRVEHPAPVITVTAEIARSCVRAALRTIGIADDGHLDSIAARARSSAALPELRLRAVRTLGETGRISLSADDPSRYVASGAATDLLEARLTFRLDRLLFADEEIAVERARLDRSELRSRTAAKVLQALFEWQKAYTASQDPALSADERWTAALREAESTAILDVMTGGWFGTFRVALAARIP